MAFFKVKSTAAFWAWTFSIALHVIVLGAFGLTGFTGGSACGKEEGRITARIIRSAELDSQRPRPKPKVNRTPVIYDKHSRDTESADSIEIADIFNSAENTPEKAEDLAPRKEQFEPFADASGGGFGGSVDFFGSRTDRRRICYVVDRSASMYGIFSRVRSRLKDSVRSLEPDQYFNVIFFGNSRLLALSPESLLRASPATKSKACDFIDGVRPAGKTNALTAIEKALMLRDHSGKPTELVYFLTDGFELTADSGNDFVVQAEQLLDRYCPNAKINTIGFWPREWDSETLARLAAESGGDFVTVTAEEE